MKLQITVSSNNQAVTGDDADSEIEQMLTHVAQQIEYGFDAGALRDSNGNLAEAWSIVRGQT